jgi:hypothetical protein
MQLGHPATESPILGFAQTHRVHAPLFENLYKLLLLCIRICAYDFVGFVPWKLSGVSLYAETESFSWTMFLTMYGILYQNKKLQK